MSWAARERLRTRRPKPTSYLAGDPRHPDGRQVVAVDSAGRLKTADAASGAVQGSIDLPLPPSVAPLPHCAALSEDGKTAALDDLDGGVVLFDTGTGKAMQRWKGAVRAETVSALAF